MLNAKIKKHIPKNSKFDMPDLITLCKEKNFKIKCYKGNYFWLDIGRIDDFEQANDIFREKKKMFLP